MDRGEARQPGRLTGAGLLLAVATLTGCGSFEMRDGAPGGPKDFSSLPDAVPRQDPPSRYGNPASYQVFGKTYHVMSASAGYVERGIASWYGTKFHGRHTSSREIYDMYAMTAAHKTLPLPTYARVTNLQNGRSVVVRINDRGPFHEGRIIDLSYAAAGKLGILDTGTGQVEVRALSGSETLRPSSANPPASAAVPSAAPRYAAAPLTASRLYLQAGAFLSRNNAEALRERIASASDAPVLVQETHGEQATLYRVRIGPLPDTEAASRLTRQLSGLGVHEPKLVSE